MATVLGLRMSSDLAKNVTIWKLGYTFIEIKNVQITAILSSWKYLQLFRKWFATELYWYTTKKKT